MDNADLIPPTPKSMSDWELEQALETSKAQSDGMIAAMILLEQESQLRTEDDLAAKAWITKLENIGTAEAIQALADFRLANPRFAVQEAVPKPAQQEVSEPAQQEVSEPAQPEVAELVQHEVQEPVLEAVDAPVIPVPMPAPVSQEAAFDEMLAVGAAEATDAIVLPVDSSDSAVANAPIEPEQEDFSVTGLLGQIVQQVNSEFSADEDATALEESEHAPIGAFSDSPSSSESEPVNAQQRSKPVAHKLDWSAFWSRSLVVGLALPAAAAFWAATQGITSGSLLLGLAIALLANLGFQSLVTSAHKGSARDISVLTRANFGVYGNTLPSLLVFVFRALLVVVVSSTLAFALMPAINSAPVATSASPLVISWGAVAAGGVIIVGILVAFLPAFVRTWVKATIATSSVIFAIVSCLLGGGGLQFGLLDPAQVLLVAVVGLLALVAISGFENAQPRATGGGAGYWVALLGSGVLLPLVAACALAQALSGQLTATGASTTFADFALGLPGWQAQWQLIAVMALGIGLVASLLEFAGRAHGGLFVARGGVQLSIAFAVALVGALVLGLQTSWFGVAAKLVLVLALPVFAWLAIFVGEGLLRHLPYHDVSLLRGYAFYKRFGIVTKIGFVVSVALGVGLTTVDGLAWSGFLTRWLDSILFFGNLSGAFWAFTSALVWTLMTSLPKIRRQEREIAAIDERRSEIAGVELPQ